MMPAAQLWTCAPKRRRPTALGVATETPAVDPHDDIEHYSFSAPLRERQRLLPKERRGNG